MTNQIKNITQLTKTDGLQIGESLKGIKNSMINNIQTRIDFLYYVLPYTNKSQLKRKHKNELKRLHFALASLNVEVLSVTLDEYLNTLQIFAKQGVVE